MTDYTSSAAGLTLPSGFLLLNEGGSISGDGDRRLRFDLKSFLQRRQALGDSRNIQDFLAVFCRFVDCEMGRDGW